MLKTKIIGYGYERPDRDFKAHECDLVFIDTSATKREERGEALKLMKRGDTLVVFSWKELAPGRLKAQMVAELDAMGVTVDLVDPPEAAKVVSTERGMPDDAKAYILPKWRSPTRYSVEYVQADLERTGHGTFTRNQLNYALGPRVKVTPPTDAPLEETDE